MANRSFGQPKRDSTTSALTISGSICPLISRGPMREEVNLSAAVDVGGTFIDVVVSNSLSGDSKVAKVLHRQGEQGADIIHAIADLASALGGGIRQVETIIIGTTVVTNALLEGKLARTALVTTDGFRGA